MCLPKPRMIKLTIWTSLLCFIFGSLLISCGGYPETPESTVLDFFNAIKNGNAKLAFQKYVENGDEILAEAWDQDEDGFEEWQNKMKDISFEITEAKMGDDEAVISVNISDKEGKELDTDEMEMKLIDGRWKISAKVFD